MFETHGMNWSENVRVKDKLAIGPTVIQPSSVGCPTSTKVYCIDDIDCSKPFSTTIIFEDDFDVNCESGPSQSELPAECVPVKIPSVDTYGGDGGSGTRGSEDVNTIIHKVDFSEDIDLTKPYTTTIIFDDDFDDNNESGTSHSKLPTECVPVKIPSGQRPYKCHLPDCGQAFIQLCNLQQHLRNHDAQVKRAKNTQVICSSLRIHTPEHYPALMTENSTATPCAVCHKAFGGEAFIKHMNTTHKDPDASGVASPPATSPYPAQAEPQTDPYIAKRRTANHPCPVCGKHYLEGYLRRFPCFVCPAVFTNEFELLWHIVYNMQMDSKHQFVAQNVLSHAIADEWCKCDILAAMSGILNNGGFPPQPPSEAGGQLSPEINIEAFRLAQEQRLERALRMHNPRMTGFNMPSPVQQAAQHLAAAQQAAQQAIAARQAPTAQRAAQQAAAAQQAVQQAEQQMQLLARYAPRAPPYPDGPGPAEALAGRQRLRIQQSEALRLAISRAAHAGEAMSPLRHYRMHSGGHFVVHRNIP